MTASKPVCLVWSEKQRTPQNAHIETCLFMSKARTCAGCLFSDMVRNATARDICWATAALSDGLGLSKCDGAFRIGIENLIDFDHIRCQPCLLATPVQVRQAARRAAPAVAVEATGGACPSEHILLAAVIAEHPSMANSRTVCVLIKPNPWRVHEFMVAIGALVPPVVVAVGSIQRIARPGRADRLRFELDQGENSGKAGSEDQQRRGAEPPPAARFGSDPSRVPRRLHRGPARARPHRLVARGVEDPQPGPDIASRRAMPEHSPPRPARRHHHSQTAIARPTIQVPFVPFFRFPGS